jgi:hypothetical protein
MSFMNVAYAPALKRAQQSVDSLEEQMVVAGAYHDMGPNVAEIHFDDLSAKLIPS